MSENKLTLLFNFKGTLFWKYGNPSKMEWVTALDQMLGDLDKMLGNWNNKCSEKLEQKFGGNFLQLLTGGISREKKCIPDIP